MWGELLQCLYHVELGIDRLERLRVQYYFEHIRQVELSKFIILNYLSII